jgi:hypothetical protein
MDCRHARLLLDYARPQGTELEARDTHELETHLGDCPECGELARQERRADEHLARAMRDVPVPDNLRGRLVSRLAVERDSYYRRLLMRGLGLAAAAAALILLLWGGWIWHKNRRLGFNPEDVIAFDAQPTFSPEAVEGWFKERYKRDVHAPGMNVLRYDRLTSYGLAEFAGTGKQVPMLLFSYGGKDVAIADHAVAKVFILTAKEFRGLKDLANQLPRGSKGYQVKVIPNPQYPDVYYVVLYTDGSWSRFFRAPPIAV